MTETFETSITYIIVNSFIGHPVVWIFNSPFDRYGLSSGVWLTHWETSSQHLHVLVWFTVQIKNKRVQSIFHCLTCNLPLIWFFNLAALHAVCSCQHPATCDENSSTDVSEWLSGARWLHLHRNLPGYRSWTDFQTPKDSGKSLFWLRYATGGKLFWSSSRRERCRRRADGLPSWWYGSCWQLTSRFWLR